MNDWGYVLNRWEKVIDFEDSKLVVVLPDMRDYVADILETCEAHIANWLYSHDIKILILKTAIAQCRASLKPIKYSHASFERGFTPPCSGIIIHDYVEWVGSKSNIPNHDLRFINFGNPLSKTDTLYTFNHLTIEKPITIEGQAKSIIDNLGLDFWKSLYPKCD